MDLYIKIFIGIMIPFIGTTLGSAVAFFFKRNINPIVEKIFLGFASGVMIAASVWSLLIPSIEMATNQGKVGWIPATLGLIAGTLFLKLTDRFIEKVDLNNKISIDRKTSMLVFAVTLHNIPEGMAVGVVFASLLNPSLNVELAAAFALAIGIAIQNFPEGATISLPLRANGMKRTKAFWIGTLSGIVEPIAGIITILLSNFIGNLLPFLLAFAAGAMIFVIVEELIPESQKGKYSSIGTIGVIVGFAIMMILDNALG
ncbi:MAG: ZIP family metal transporter [Candidatus Scatovivens sp.]